MDIFVKTYNNTLGEKLLSSLKVISQDFRKIRYVNMVSWVLSYVDGPSFDSDCHPATCGKGMCFLTLSDGICTVDHM